MRDAEKRAERRAERIAGRIEEEGKDIRTDRRRRKGYQDG